MSDPSAARPAHGWQALASWKGGAIIDDDDIHIFTWCAPCGSLSLKVGGGVERSLCSVLRTLRVRVASSRVYSTSNRVLHVYIPFKRRSTSKPSVRCLCWSSFARVSPWVEALTTMRCCLLTIDNIDDWCWGNFETSWRSDITLLAANWSNVENLIWVTKLAPQHEQIHGVLTWVKHPHYFAT